MSSYRTPALVIAIALWLPVFCLVSSLAGCDTTSPNTLKPLAPPVAAGISNAALVLMTTAAAVPAQPISGAIEAGAAAVLALLAAWQGLTHSKVQKLTASSKASPLDSKL